MKNFFFIVVFCIAGAMAARAQMITIHNNTMCDVQVKAICYNTTTCLVTSMCNSVVVQAGTQGTINQCNCGVGTMAGYEVCWTNANCTTVCTNVGIMFGGPCSGFPTSTTLPGCSATCCNATTGYTVQYAIGSMELFIN